MNNQMLRPGDPLRRGLLWGLATTLLLPIVIAVTLGTAALLAAVGDAAAATACRWVTVPLAMLWVVAVVATTTLSAVCHLLRPPRRPRKTKPCAPATDR